MSPSIIKSGETPVDSDFDLKNWLKEIEGAENLMNDVEAKADNLQAKVDALLLEVGQPVIAEQNQDTIMVDSSTISDEQSKATLGEDQEKKST